MLMSFLGTIDYIMKGSGLKGLFNTVYTMNSIEKFMSGHVYARVVIAHILVHTAIAKIIMNMINLNPRVKARLEEILYNADQREVHSANEDDCECIYGGKNFCTHKLTLKTEILWSYC